MNIIEGDALTILKEMKTSSIDCVMTSPPYWALRDYGMKKQIGLEKTLNEYVENLCIIFDEVKRVLKPTGTCWVNLGDTYYGGGRNKGNTKPHPKGVRGLTHLGDTVPGPKGQSKSLAQIPARFAIAMTARGWILRNEIIWQKPNCMPSSVNDRFTVDYEKLFFFTKNKKYYFEKQIEPAKEWGTRDRTNGKYKKAGLANGLKGRPASFGRNKRCVWKINTKPVKAAHFATFPEELVSTPIRAGCPKRGWVLDPFIGSGTTGIVAEKLGRKCIGIELNPKYIAIAESRMRDYKQQKANEKNRGKN